MPIEILHWGTGVKKSGDIACALYLRVFRRFLKVGCVENWSHGQHYNTAVCRGSADRGVWVLYVCVTIGHQYCVVIVGVRSFVVLRLKRYLGVFATRY